MTLENTRIYIWGAGTRGRRLLSYCRALMVGIVAFIDSNEAICGKMIDGCPIISFDDYKSIPEDKIVIISPLDCEDIINTLGKGPISRYIFYEDIMRDRDGMPVMPARISRREIRQQDGLCYSLLREINERFSGKINDDFCQDVFLHEFLQQGDYTNIKEIADKLNAARHPLINTTDQNINSAARILFKDLQEVEFSFWLSDSCSFDLLIVHGLGIDLMTHCLIMKARRRKLPIIFEEDGFLRSILPISIMHENRLMCKPLSVTFEMNGIYFNAHTPSLMERILNSPWEINTVEWQRARDCMARIRTEKLSKYNHQPLSCTEVFRGQKRGKNILVIDQVPGDKSIEYGMSSDDTFALMLEKALYENPEDTIFLKAHPASDKRHFTGKEGGDRVIFLEKPVNPIALLEQMDKVYVCSSTMGMEALMCGCEVHCFGMPFYAGWGVTRDRQVCGRRIRNRSLEEIFYVAYIMCSIYVSYKRECRCEIEEAMDELIELRSMYFRELQQ